MIRFSLEYSFNKNLINSCDFCVHSIKFSQATDMLLIRWFFGWFYGISTFIGYLTPNPCLCK